MTSGLSPELQKLIRQHIQSVEQLEILCALIEDPARSWAEGAVYHRIQSSLDSVSRNLRQFANQGFLAHDPSSGYRFSPQTPELQAFSAELLKAYRERRVSVIEAIYQAPFDPIRQFADAFNLRKDKP